MLTIRIILLLSFLFTSFLQLNAQSKSSEKNTRVKVEKRKKKRNKKVKLPKIDLNNWYVTTPAQGEDGKPIIVEPPEILDYATNMNLRPYMYTDSIRGTIVFYAEPTKATTPNSKYSRSELREQMVPGDNNVNWTFADGGTLKAKLSVDKVSRDDEGEYHRIIILQIHGRLTNEQRDLIGQKDNNAPPVLKIYWDKGKIRVKTKILKDINTPYEQMLHKDAWGDDEGFNFEQEVGFRKFSLEIRASKGKIVVVLNNADYKVYENIHLEKWGVFENYFKAGNYFQSRDEGSFAKVSFFELEVSH